MNDQLPESPRYNIRWMILIAAMLILILGYIILGPDGFAG